MKKKKKKINIKNIDPKLLKIISLFIVSIIFILLVKFYDTNNIGPKYSEVGFSSLNALINNITGYNEIFYKLTKYLGFIPFLLVAYYAYIGIQQLIKRKNLLKVDKKIIILGLFYIAVLLVYIFFEKVVINYRPILMDGELEASFPSSHTMMALCICLSSLLISKDYIKNKKTFKIINIITIIIMFTLVIGRLISGVHWLTDIIGGIIISFTLVSIYEYLITKLK